MKELSIEEKAKAYDEALERAEKALEVLGTDKCEGARQILSLFPELKKSEDERIRKAIIEYLRQRLDRSPSIPAAIGLWIAWLEKQGAPNQTSIWKHWKDGIAGNGEGKLIYLIKNGNDYHLSSCLGFECDYIELSELDNLMLEKQGEQKPQRIVSAEAKESLLHDKYEGLTDFERTLADICIGWIGEELGWKQYIKDNADVLLKIAVEKFNSVQDVPFEQKPVNNIEPKFKIGNWVVNKGHSYLIADIDFLDNRYLFEIGGYTHEQLNWEYIENVDKKYHLWTIADAKDGDVLASELCDSIILFKGIKDNNIDFYCDYDFSKIDIPGDRFAVNNGQHYGSVEDSKDFHPATKEQRDLLFSKMKEAGYEWDAKRKKLKKIDARENLTLDGDLMEADCMISEQKPAWSEDESIISDLLDYFDEDKCLKHEVNDIVKWLKTIKPQQKGWSDNEIKMFDNLITYLDGRKGLLEEIKRTYIDWLKSIKSRVKPKQEWSEEDQNALEDVREAVVHYWGGDSQDILLYWLKSLKQRIKGE